MKLWLICVLSAACFVLWITKLPAKDLGQWESADPELRMWYEALRQPDNPTVSCCGSADAYWCDEINAGEGGASCRITDTRDDTPLRRPHVPIGTEIKIPPNKFGPGKWGNPTGHTVVFLSYSRDVYCFVQQGGV